MKIFNLPFLLLFLLSFPSDRALEFPQPSPISDIQLNQKSDNSSAEKSGHSVVSNIILKSTDADRVQQLLFGTKRLYLINITALYLATRDIYIQLGSPVFTKIKRKKRMVAYIQKFSGKKPEQRF
jgi:hypothetical protein